jgi:hypothetical protein
MTDNIPTIDIWTILLGADRLHGLDFDDEALEILKLAEAYFGSAYADKIAESRQEIADTIARYGRVS